MFFQNYSSFWSSAYNYFSLLEDVQKAVTCPTKEKLGRLVASRRKLDEDWNMMTEEQQIEACMDAGIPRNIIAAVYHKSPNQLAELRKRKQRQNQPTSISISSQIMKLINQDKPPTTIAEKYPTQDVIRTLQDHEKIQTIHRNSDYLQTKKLLYEEGYMRTSNKLVIDTVLEILAENDRKAQEVSNIQMNYEREMSEMRTNYEREMSEMRTNYEREMSEMRTNYEREMSEMRTNYEREMSEMRTNYEKGLSRADAWIYGLNRNNQDLSFKLTKCGELINRLRDTDLKLMNDNLSIIKSNKIINELVNRFGIRELRDRVTLLSDYDWLIMDMDSLGKRSHS